MSYTLRKSLLLFSTILGIVSTAPGGGFVAVAGVKPPITFDGGNIGVNLGGYHASAGLGGLLGGGAAGGLHAEAGTPFGQEAAAGLGGVISEGKTAGELYAGADSGVGPAAGVALGGAKTAYGAVGGSVSGATTGELYVSKTTETQNPVVVEKTIQAAPEVQKTYIERTVIPNYVEKTIQVPSYVEKTIRVPTVVEKRVKVPAPPTIIEKTVNAPPETTNAGVSSEVVAQRSGGITVIEKTRPLVYKHWSYRKPAFGGFFAGGIGGAAGAGTDYSYGTGYGGGGSAVYSVRKSPELVNDIFNIPIATLGAVSRLVGGLAGGASGSFSASKQISFY